MLAGDAPRRRGRMDNPDLQARLMKTFLVEMEDHVATLNQALLQLEKETAAERRAELVRSLFRAAHSLTGAARPLGQAGLEGCWQHLESVEIGSASCRDRVCRDW